MSTQPSLIEQLLSSLRALDFAGYLMIAAILAMLGGALLLHAWARGRYALLDRHIRRAGADDGPSLDGEATLPHFRDPFLRSVTDDLGQALRQNPADVNLVAIIEHRVNTHLRGLLFAERFVKSASGLVIILGLAGTFYGLTLSIGKLVSLVAMDSGAASASNQANSVANLTESLTTGLTQTLAGMSVAFTTSLAGITAAVILTLVGVFSQLAERRHALITHLEVVLDGSAQRMLAERAPRDPAMANLAVADRLDAIMHSFGQGMSHLSQNMDRFEQSLANFAATSRDFSEFNLHLKDNVARMSLAFADLGENLKSQTRPLGSRERG